MAKVYIVKNDKLGDFPADWSIYRLGTGPGRCEGQGFKTVREVRAFAKKWCHEIVTPTPKEKA